MSAGALSLAIGVLAGALSRGQEPKVRDAILTGGAALFLGELLLLQLLPLFQ